MTSTDTQSKNERLSYNRTIGGHCHVSGRGFYYPVDIVADEDDRLYVLNRSSDGDKRGVRVTIMNLEEGLLRYLRRLGCRERPVHLAQLDHHG